MPFDLISYSIDRFSKQSAWNGRLVASQKTSIAGIHDLRPQYRRGGALKAMSSSTMIIGVQANPLASCRRSVLNTMMVCFIFTVLAQA